MLLPLLLLVVAATSCDIPIFQSNSLQLFPATHFDQFSAPCRLFSNSSGPPQVEYGQNGLHLSIIHRFDNPQVVSLGYIMYGKVEAEIMGLGARGVISSLYLQSDDLDEIDVVELSGSYHDAYQTNYFVKGNVSNYERGFSHHLPSSPHINYHKYGLEWTPHEMIWLVDNNVVRRVGRDNPHGFPTSPQKVYISIWAGGDPENKPGTIQWAGGLTDYEQVPYSMDVRNMLVVNYLGDMYKAAGKEQEKKEKGGNEEKEQRRNEEEEESHGGKDKDEKDQINRNNKTEHSHNPRPSRSNSPSLLPVVLIPVCNLVALVIEIF